MFERWKGGNMPANEDLMYQWVNSESSWNVFFFALILAVVTFGVGAVFLTMGMAAFAALGVGIGYALLSGGNLSAAQQGFFGQTGNGWVNPIVASSQQQQGLMTSVVKKFGVKSRNRTLNRDFASKEAVKCRFARLDPMTLDLTL